MNNLTPLVKLTRHKSEGKKYLSKRKRSISPTLSKYSRRIS